MKENRLLLSLYFSEGRGVTELSRAEVANLMSHIIKRGINLEELAETSGVPVPTIIMIMRGQLRPYENIRIALAEALGIDPKVLVS